MDTPAKLPQDRKWLTAARLPDLVVSKGPKKPRVKRRETFGAKIYFAVFHHSVTQGWGCIVDKESVDARDQSASWRGEGRPL